MKRGSETDTPPMFDYWDRFNVAVAGEEAAHAHKMSRALEHERQAGRTKRKNRSNKLTPAKITLAEIASLIQHRHGGPCDTDDGGIYLRGALPWIIETAGGFEGEEFDSRIRSWAKTLVPRLTETEIVAGIDEARDRNARGRLYWNAPDLGTVLHLSVTERETLGITKARPRSMSAKQFKVYQRSRKTAAEKARRIAAGAAAREQSDAQTKPWEALGVSRRTFYRNRKAMPEIGRGTNSCLPAPKERIATTGQCHGDGRTLQVPARQASPSRIVGADGHSPRGIPRAVRTGHAVPLPLPGVGVSQLDLLTDFQPLGIVANTYLGGTMPPELALAVRAAQRARLVTQETVARSIGISRPQLANALQGRFGLSQSAAANLMRWLEAA